MPKTLTANPLPVAIEDQAKPLDVTIIDTVMPPAQMVTTSSGTSLAPTTTEAEDKVTEGQRHISRIWEYSQALIALVVTGSTVYVLARLAVATADVTANQLISAMQLNVMTTLILTFYFARTNHVAIGGIGKKANEEGPYRGR